MHGRLISKVGKLIMLMGLERIEMLSLMCAKSFPFKGNFDGSGKDNLRTKHGWFSRWSCSDYVSCLVMCWGYFRFFMVSKIVGDAGYGLQPIRAIARIDAPWSTSSWRKTCNADEHSPLSARRILRLKYLSSLNINFSAVSASIFIVWVGTLICSFHKDELKLQCHNIAM